MSTQRFKGWGAVPGKKKPLQAQKCIASDGAKCDSIAEKDLYEVFLKMGIEFQFQVRFVLIGPTIPKSSTKKAKAELPLFRDRCAESVNLTVDFVLEHDGITYYVDAKGSKVWAKRDSKLRYDIFKHQLHREGKSGCSRIVFVESKEIKTLAQYAAFDRGNFWDYFITIKER